MGNRITWEKRYDTDDFIHGSQPSEYLRANADLLPPAGLALDIAAGEGRNSIFMAERGLSVVALDIAVGALKKCKVLASERKVEVDLAAVDLSTFDLRPATFDVIINFNYLERRLAPGIVTGLRRGGLLIFETFAVDHLKWDPGFKPGYLLRRGELPQLFHGLSIIKYREATLRTGQSVRSLASIIARKQ